MIEAHHGRRAVLLAGLAVPLAACSSRPASPSTPSASPIPPRRVVTLDGARTEDVLALGLQPVGVAGAAAYRRTVTRPALAAKAVELGDRAALDLEAVRACRPDLVLGTDLDPGLLERLRAIAPTESLAGPFPTRALAVPRENLQRTGALLGREQQAADLLVSLDEKIGTTRLALAGRLNPPTILLQIGADASVHLLGPGSAVGLLAQQVGVVDPVTNNGDARGAVATTWQELPRAERIWWWASPEARQAMKGLATDPRWTSLPAVRAKAARPVLQGHDPFAGASSLLALLDELVALYGAKKK
ncbi:ABC transporter substrate-binding protein [Luteococcus peritonei]|uniref:ABC transporter substrate-binding protein n=1 Tax=Luteococcus peritonei TaxID=88874 RepID=A0ABW4RQY1_9ACTN